MGYYLLSGVLALYLSTGEIEYRKVSLTTCFDAEWAFDAENEEPDTTIIDDFVLEAPENENVYITSAVCFPGLELGND